MKHEAIDGVVIRVRDNGDHDRYLTVLTAKKGRITLLSKGSRAVNSPMRAVSQLFTYANFEFYKKEDFRILKGGSPIQPFYSLTFDINRMNLASYLCDLAYELSDEGIDAEELQKLLLNSLYAVSRDLYPQERIKGAFELRAIAISGYAPDLGGCEKCGDNGVEDYYLNVMNGSILCDSCYHKQGNGKKADDYNEIREAEVICPISSSVVAAMRYVISCPPQRLFSFELQEKEDLSAFAKTAEMYLLSHLGRDFDSLRFYHSLYDKTPLKKEEK